MDIVSLVKMVGSVTVDAMIVEQHSFSSTPTEIPIETGAVVTDHVVNNPDVITIEGFIGQAPFGGAGIGLSRVKQAHNTLKQLMKARLPISIITGLDVYNSMIITNYDVPRDVDTGADLHFTLTAQKIVQVSSQNIAASVDILNNPSAGQLGDTVNAGIQAKEEAQSNILVEDMVQKVKNGEATYDEGASVYGSAFEKLAEGRL